MHGVRLVLIGYDVGGQLSVHVHSQSTSVAQHTSVGGRVAVRNPRGSRARSSQQVVPGKHNTHQRINHIGDDATCAGKVESESDTSFRGVGLKRGPRDNTHHPLIHDCTFINFHRP